MRFSFGMHPFVLVLLIVAALVFTIWTYGRSVPAITSVKRRILVAIRSSALLLLLLLLAQPTITRLANRNVPPLTVFLTDDSQSAGLAESEADLDVADQIRSLLAGIESTGLPGNLKFYGFAEDLRDWGSHAGAISDSLQFLGIRTNISRALVEVEKRHTTDNLRAVVLISDGRYNAGRNPVYVAEEGATPVFSIAVGDTTDRRDIRISSVSTNELAYMNQELPVHIRLQSSGFEGRSATVSVWDGGQRLDVITTTLPPDGSEHVVELRFVPTEVGMRNLFSRVSAFESELTHSNNTESFAVRVLDNRQRILMISSGPSPDLAALRNLLSDDENLEIIVRTQRSPGAYYEGPLPDDLESLDLMLFAGFPGQGADPADMQHLAAEAAAGIPLLFLLDRGTDLGALKTYFNQALPAQPAAVRPGFIEAQFEAAPESRVHPVMGNNVSQNDAWRSLPPLVYNESLWRTSPDSRILATIRIRNLPLDDPLLVVRSRSGLRSAAFLGAGTWRWQNLPADLEIARDVWPTLFHNLLRWLSARNEDRPVRVVPVEDLFDGQQPVEFSGQVYNESLEPISDALVQVRITTPTGTVETLSMEPLGNGRYLLNAGRLLEGSYRYAAIASRGQTTIGEDRGSFAVGATSVEYKELQADVATMRQIALRSGGEHLSGSSISRLPKILEERLVAISVEDRTSVNLWHTPVFLVLILMLLVAEWVIRKRAGMV